MLVSSNQDLLQYVDGSEGRAELQEGVDTMLAVLKCLNDSMHQVAITAFPVRHMQAYFLFVGAQCWIESAFVYFSSIIRHLLLSSPPMEV